MWPVSSLLPSNPSWEPQGIGDVSELEKDTGELDVDLDSFHYFLSTMENM